MLIINRQNNHYIFVHGQLVVAVAQSGVDGQKSTRIIK